MHMYRHESLDRVLDRCIDRLIGGAGWGDLLPDEAAERSEMQRLMAVAELLRQASGAVKPMARESKDRLARVLDRAGVHLARLLPGLSQAWAVSMPALTG